MVFNFDISRSVIWNVLDNFCPGLQISHERIVIVDFLFYWGNMYMLEIRKIFWLYL